jgi:hypothetical protein
MTRRDFRAFKCRMGIHRFVVGWFLGGYVLKNAYCRDCGKVRVPTGTEPVIRPRR